MKKNMKVLILLIGYLGFAQDTPIGSVIAFMGDITEIDRTKWAVCDGRTLEIANYVELFNTINWRYGYGEDIKERTKFNIPDLRGVFLRGVDDGRGLDPDASKRTVPNDDNLISGDKVGSYQNDSYKYHDHKINDPKHKHRVASGWSVDDPDDHKRGGGELTNGGLSAGDHYSAEVETGITVLPNGFDETRPKNVSVIWIIRIK